VIAAAREAAEKAGVEGWKFGLKMPSYLPVMQYADSRACAKPSTAPTPPAPPRSTTATASPSGTTAR
jgi:hypothetical protein